MESRMKMYILSKAKDFWWKGKKTRGASSSSMVYSNWLIDHLKGFEISKSKPTLYVMKKAVHILIVSVYVDDLIFTSNDEKMLQDFKKGMKKTY